MSVFSKLIQTRRLLLVMLRITSVKGICCQKQNCAKSQASCQYTVTHLLTWTMFFLCIISYPTHVCCAPPYHERRQVFSSAYVTHVICADILSYIRIIYSFFKCCSHCSIIHPYSEAISNTQNSIRHLELHLSARDIINLGNASWTSHISCIISLDNLHIQGV